MKKADMQKLGIREGDVVKLTGGRTAHAFCVTWDDNYDSQNERNFVCLDESSKNIPVIKVSDQTYSNLQNLHFANPVELEKSSAVKAEKLAIMPIYAQSGNEKRDYNLGWLKNNVLVSKGDRIVGKHDDPRKIPGFFVVDGTPDSGAWIVGKDTPVVISAKPADSPRMIRDGGNLTSVIPVVQKIKGDDFEVTIPSIEVYDNCMKIHLYVRDTVVHQEDWTSGLCTPAIRAWDDLGNKYLLNRFAGRSGGTQLGDVVWGEIDRLNFSEVSCIITPALDSKARELTLSIEQLMWDVRKRPGPQKATPVTQGLPIMMTPVSPLEEKYAIHGGPWEFKILLEKFLKK